MSNPTYQTAAKRLVKHLAEAYGLKLSLAQGLEAIAAQHGARNWNTLRARGGVQTIDSPKLLRAHATGFPDLKPMLGKPAILLGRTDEDCRSVIQAYAREVNRQEGSVLVTEIRDTPSEYRFSDCQTTGTWRAREFLPGTLPLPFSIQSWFDAGLDEFVRRLRTALCFRSFRGADTTPYVRELVLSYMGQATDATAKSLLRFLWKEATPYLAQHLYGAYSTHPGVTERRGEFLPADQFGFDRFQGRGTTEFHTIHSRMNGMFPMAYSQQLCDDLQAALDTRVADNCTRPILVVLPVGLVSKGVLDKLMAMAKKNASFTFLLKASSLEMGLSPSLYEDFSPELIVCGPCPSRVAEYVVQHTAAPYLENSVEHIEARTAWMETRLVDENAPPPRLPRDTAYRKLGEIHKTDAIMQVSPSGQFRVTMCRPPEPEPLVEEQ